MNDVVPVPSVLDIRAGARPHHVVARPGIEHVVAGPAADDVVPLSGVDHVVAVVGADDVVAAAAVDQVCPTGPVQVVGAVGASDDVERCRRGTGCQDERGDNKKDDRLCLHFLNLRSKVVDAALYSRRVCATHERWVSACKSSGGSEMVNAVPVGELVTRTSPPIACASSRTIASPRPVPTGRLT